MHKHEVAENRDALVRHDTFEAILALKYFCILSILFFFFSVGILGSMCGTLDKVRIKWLKSLIDPFNHHQKQKKKKATFQYPYEEPFREANQAQSIDLGISSSVKMITTAIYEINGL